MGEHGDQDARRRDRISTACCVVVLATVAFSIAPGRLLPDTKLDMPLNPGGFLTRALHMWDPSSYFGQVQNQAYGYLFPMGPWFLAGRLAGLAPWVVQRLWLTLVLCTAFLGIVKLAAVLRIGTPGTRLLAGVAYTFAPGAQELLSVNSSEFWPTALLPWIVLPLVHGTREGASPRRAAALSALAIVLCGGINATAVVAVLPVPLLYLLTRAAGPRKRRLLGWWLGFGAAATLWWLGPAYLMGKYIFPFLDYTESATTTTHPTSLVNALRGTSSWVGYLPISGGSAWWPAGTALSNSPSLIVVTSAVAALGLLGLSRPGLRERTFLLVTLVVGVAIITTGHPSVLAAPFSGHLRNLLDGTLAPFRNLHKFDALIRLPVALGLASLVAHRSVTRPWARPALAGLTLLMVGLSVVTVLDPGLATRGTPEEIPGYWRQAAGWLNRHAGRNAVLAVPGVATGDFMWGTLMDDPMQPLLRVRWANRMQVPYGSAGESRLIAAIDDRFATGYGSAGLGQVLTRMGIRYLLVRNDLDRTAIHGAWPARVHEAIGETPGLRRVAGFGGMVGTASIGDATSNVDQRYQAVEIYEVPQPNAVVSVVSGSDPLHVAGGPEALLTLADEGLLDDRPVLLNDDGAAGPDTIVTDTLRRREVNFSDLRDGASPTMTADQPYRGSSRAKDVTALGWSRYQAVAHYSGIQDVTASSSASDSTAIAFNGSRSSHPFAALDADPGTAWISSGWHSAVGEWISVRFDRPRSPEQLKVAFVVSELLGPAVSEVSVETAAGSLRQRVDPTSAAQVLRTPPGLTGWVRIRVTALAAAPQSNIGARVGITDLSIPGVTPQRQIVLPAVAASTQVFTGQPDSAPGCMRGSVQWVCSPFLTRHSEDGAAFSRDFTAMAGADRLTGSAILTDPTAIRALTSPQVEASSTYVEHPADMPRSAFDGDPTTAWMASPDDQQPRLSIGFGKTIDLSSLRFSFPNAFPEGMPVLVTGDEGTRLGQLDRNGVFAFAPMRTDRVAITFLRSPGVQVSDVEIPGIPPLGPAPRTPLPAACGQGPDFTLGSRQILTRIVSGTVADVLRGVPVRYASCTRDKDGTGGSGAIEISAGRQRLSVPSTGRYRIVAAVLRPVATAAVPAADAGTAQPGEWRATSRTVAVHSAPGGYLVVDENLNSGWTATLNGTRLAPVRIDGWKQGWLIPPDTHGVVRLAYAPDRWFRFMLVGGLLIVLLIVAAAAVPARIRPPRPESPPLRAGPVLLSVFAACAGLWTGGIGGLVLVVAAFAVTRYTRIGAAPAALLVLAAGRAVAAGRYPWLQNHDGLIRALTDGLPQALCLTALGSLIAVVGSDHAGPVRYRLRARTRKPRVPADRAREPALDGLRAIAALAVVILHVSDMTGYGSSDALPWRLAAQGGAGVAIFFVLSGLLLYRPWARAALMSENAPLVRVYLWRRAVRILPAYWLMLVIALPTLNQAHAGSIRTWAEMLTLTQNYDRHPWWPWLGPTGLTQIWSLSVEVSFYLALPFVAMALGRYAVRGDPGPRIRATRLLRGLAVITVPAFALTVAVRYSGNIDAILRYEILLPRWLPCFTAGMALAVLAERSKTDPDARLWQTIGGKPGRCWLLALCAYVLVSTPLATPLHGGSPSEAQYLLRALLYPVIAVALVAPVAFRPNQRMTLTVLGNPLVRWLGLISYGIFLWHRPILDGWYRLTARPIWHHDFGSVFQVVVLATVAAATVSYLVIERTTQRLKRRRPVNDPPVTTADTLDRLPAQHTVNEVAL